jgi:glycosyltransferase involved in cell wall biosynthesis
MISIIIPTLNEEKYIGKTLDYLSKYKGDYEIIISDTNSKDKTVEIASKYTDKIVIHSKDGKKLTIAAGRNLGASYATGDYLVFIDADICIVEPNNLFEKAYICFQKDSQLVGLTISLHVFKELETLGDRIIIPFFIYARLLMNNYLGIGAATGEFQMVKTSAFKQIGGFNELLATGEDDDFFRRLSKMGKTRLEKRLIAYHSGRREHALGWPKLLYTWTRDTISVWFLKKSVSKEWIDIR